MRIHCLPAVITSLTITVELMMMLTSHVKVRNTLFPIPSFYFDNLYTAPAFLSDNCTEGNLRLVNGKAASKGRVEICYEGVWGSICPNLWKDTNAKVACNQLGYTTIGK